MSHSCRSSKTISATGRGRRQTSNDAGQSLGARRGRSTGAMTGIVDHWCGSSPFRSSTSVPSGSADRHQLQPRPATRAAPWEAPQG